MSITINPVIGKRPPIKDQLIFTLVIFAIIGTLALIGALTSLRDSLSFVQTASYSKGTVVNQIRSKSKKSSNSYTPVIEYSLPSGEKIVFNESYSSSMIPAIGSAVEVLYSPDNPYYARTNSFVSLYMLPSGLGFFALIFLLSSVPSIYFRTLGSKKNLKTSGVKITGKAIRIESTTFRANRVNGRKIIVEGVYLSQPQTFHSQTYYDSNLESCVAKDDLIDVYISPSNPKEYFIDIDSIRPQN